MEDNFIKGAVRHLSNSSNMSTFTVYGLKRENVLPQNGYLPKLLEYNDVVMKWLRDDKSNLQKFYDNPREAFKEATGVEDVEGLIASSLEDLAAYEVPVSSPEPYLPSVAPKARLQSVPVFADYTQGWDMVSAVTQKVVNSALRFFFNGKALPYNVNLDFKILGVMDVDLSVSGEFGIPQLCGGTGSRLTIQLPLPKCDIDLKVNHGEVTHKTVENGAFKFTTELTAVESTFGKKDTEGTTFDYFIDFTNTDIMTEVELIGFSGAFGEDGTISNIKEAIKRAINQAFKGKSYKLFSIDLKGADKKYPYLIASHIKYAFIQNTKSPDENVVGVLVQTDGKGSDVLQLDVRTIPEKCNGVVVLSNRVSVDGLLRDALKSATGVSDDNLKVEEKNDSPRIIYAAEPFWYKEEVKGYRPKITKLRMWLSDNHLHMELGADVEYSSGMHLKYTVTGSFKPVVQLKEKDGKRYQEITFEKDEYSEACSSGADWWVWVVAGFVAPLALAIVGIITAIAKAEAPTLESAVFSKAIATVKWNHVSLAEIKYVNTDGHIQIGGNVTLG